ncbi:MAG: ParB/RepB/Spo0J family partition protein [Solirubrobacteraceae bacterium]
MAKAKRGMGRGLDAILSVSAGEAKEGEELRDLPVELIVANPNQPRRRFDEEALGALAGSLGERGVLQPVLVRPKPGGTYELVAGERRWRAARIAGLSEIPALVRPRDDAASLELALIENMAREDLNPIEEARACAALVEELGLTREAVGRRVGRGRVAVSNLLRLLDLPDEVVETIEQGRLSEGHGRALLLAEDHSTRRVLARDAVREGWSVRTVEARARRANEAARSQGKNAAGKVKDNGLHPDQREAAATIASSLEEAFGAEVRVRPAGGGYRAELSFAGVQEAEELARRVRAR